MIAFNDGEWMTYWGLSVKAAFLHLLFVAGTWDSVRNHKFRWLWVTGPGALCLLSYILQNNHRLDALDKFIEIEDWAADRIRQSLDFQWEWGAFCVVAGAILIIACAAVKR